MFPVPKGDTQPHNPKQVHTLVMNSLCSGYLHRMQPGLGASYPFHCRHSNMVQGADGGQTGIDRKMAATTR